MSCCCRGGGGGGGEGGGFCGVAWWGLLECDIGAALTCMSVAGRASDHPSRLFSRCCCCCEENGDFGDGTEEGICGGAEEDDVGKVYVVADDCCCCGAGAATTCLGKSEGTCRYGGGSIEFEKKGVESERMLLTAMLMMRDGGFIERG